MIREGTRIIHTHTAWKYGQHKRFGMRHLQEMLRNPALLAASVRHGCGGQDDVWSVLVDFELHT